MGAKLGGLLCNLRCEDVLNLKRGLLLGVKATWELRGIFTQGETNQITWLSHP